MDPVRTLERTQETGTEVLPRNEAAEKFVEALFGGVAPVADVPPVDRVEPQPSYAAESATTYRPS